MDFGTFFFTNIVSVTVFTVCIGVLAWNNRRVTGMTWFAGAQVVGLAKLILQGIEGKAPRVLTSLTANELYVVSMVMQWAGLYWFVMRKPAGHRRLWIAIGAILAIYIVTFFAHTPYAGNLLSLPTVGFCAYSAWILWKHREGPFGAAARVASVIAGGQAAVALFRAVVGSVRYIHPGDSIYAHKDPYWLYSLAVASFLASCMTMCEMWFLVTELQRELDRRASTDPLTGALNRRSMEESAQRESARSQRYGNQLSMIVLDIDHFKQLNDTRGHAAGDCALQTLVRAMSALLRQQDLLARVGGEEFAILLPDSSVAAAAATAERIRQAVAGLDIEFESGSIRITISAGVAEFNPACDWEEMMRRADAAMYAAKRRGRNLVSARPDSDEEAAEPNANLTQLRLLPTA